MKQIRDGLEDWELFILAENLGAKEYAREQVSRAYTQFGNFNYEICGKEGYYCPDNEPWTLDEKLLQEVRENIARKVQFLLHPDKYDDPEANTTEDGDVEEDGDMDHEIDTDTDDEKESTEQEKAVNDITETDDNNASSCHSTGKFNAWIFILLLFVARKRFFRRNLLT